MAVDQPPHLTAGVGPLVYRMLSGLRGRLPAALAITVVVAVAGAVGLALVAGAARTASAPSRYSDSRGGTAGVSLEQAAGRPRTDELRSLPAVTSVETASFVFGGLLAPGSDQPIDTLLFAGTDAAFGLRLTEGRRPDPSSATEFLATPSFVEGAGAAVGDQFQVITLTQEQADELGFDVPEPAGPTFTGRLVGVIDGPALLQDPYPLVLFPAAALESGDVGVAATIGLISLAPGATVEELRAQLDRLPDGEVFGLEPAEWVSEEVRSAVTTQAQGLAVVAAIVAIATVAVLGQLLTRQVRLSEPQRLAMRAVGLTRSQVVADGVGRVIPPVVTGALAAAILAFAASGLFPLGFVELVEPRPGLLFDPLLHGLGAAVLAAVLLGWVALGLQLGGRRAPAPREVSLVERLAPRLGSVAAATGLRFAFSGARRDPRSASLAGLLVVLVVLVGGLTFGANLARLIDEPRRYGSNFDLLAGQGGDEIAEEVRAALLADPDVAAVTLFGTTLVAAGTVSVDVTGMQQLEGDLVPDVVEGELPRTADEIILGRVAARDLGVDIDDQLTLGGATGPVSFRVAGVAVIPSVEGGDGMGEGGVVTLEGLRRIDPSARLGVAAIALRPGAPAGVTERLTVATGMQIGGAPDRPSSIFNLGRVRSIPYLVAAALGALAALSMAHQLITSANARRRDVAVLRSFGADRRCVTGVVHWQASAVVLVLLALAAPLGAAGGSVVSRTLVDRLGAVDETVLPFGHLGAALLVLLVVGNLAAALPASRARRRLPARVLAEE